MKKKLSVGFVGLTHLGLNYLAAASKKGIKVTGADLNSKKIDKLNNFIIEHKEPRLKNTIYRNRKNIFFTNNFSSLKECKIVFISQDVETDTRGKGNFNYLRKLINKTIKFINKESLLIILSQVKPGFTRSINFDKSRLYYQVETLIFGNALERALNPERIIIGCDNSKFKVNRFFLHYLKKFNCPIIKMKYESAELTKISINVLLASSITTANVLAQASKEVSADWYEIMPALKLDQRIGKKAYIKPGLGISGGNVERDIASISEILRKNVEQSSFIKSFQKNSQYMKSWVYRILKNEKILSRKNKYKIGIFGLTYKENTSSIKNSPSIYLLNKLKNIETRIYDPVAKLEKKIKNCFQVNSMKYLIKSSNVFILMTPWNHFKKINNILKIKRNKKIIIIDPYRLIDFNIIQNKYIKYFTIGK